MQVVYSWNDNRPGITFSGGRETFSFNKHTTRGSATVNLISRFPRVSQSSSEQALFIGNDNVRRNN